MLKTVQMDVAIKIIYIYTFLYIYTVYRYKMYYVCITFTGCNINSAYVSLNDSFTDREIMILSL